MSIPVWILLSFAAWTLLTLILSVGVYRWSRILTGRASISEWRADEAQGSEWYQRAMRAHQNCVENLPIYTAIVVAHIVTGVTGNTLDALAVTIMGARVCHTIVHLSFPQTNFVTGIRFSFFFVQIVAMAAMGIIIAANALA